QEDQKLAQALQQIRHKLLVMSGKGGVGKSSVAVGLALGLARRGYKVGLMDVDLHGPDVLRMLGLKDPLDLSYGQFQLPPELFDNLKIISVEVLMRNREMAVIWRGPLKHQLIRQFLTEVHWGTLDYLVIDAPPGTGDEPLSVAHTIPEAQAIIVTTPQEISLADVRKSINFCQKVNIAILGLVENMSGYHCLHCGAELPLFKRGGGEKTAHAAKIAFMGMLPFDPKVVEAADQGQLLELKEADSPFLTALAPMVNYVVETLPPTPAEALREPGVLKFAIPLEDGKLTEKFGQAKHFAIFTVKDQVILDQQVLTPPNLGTVPHWLATLGVTHVIAAGMSPRAQTLLNRKGMEVLPGTLEETPEQLVTNYLKNTPTTETKTPPPSNPQCSTP
ncbi:MAG: iron-sulfur cluster carrier protein MrpORP, partial [Desulfobaccales bacterium]|nr:iron-sulfur cluster carrier protein MrpORP [Desulfobaccales bacterium]